MACHRGGVVIQIFLLNTGKKGIEKYSAMFVEKPF